MLNFILLPFLFSISQSESNSICPSVPSGHTAIQPDYTNFQDNQIFGCQRLFYQQLKLTNCFLQLHSCTFNNIDLDPGSTSYFNLGAIYISINDDMNVIESEKVEFNNCQFYRCTGGCIHIECTKVTIQFNFYECKFDQCTAKTGGSGIHFCAANGNIEKCFFYDNGLIENGGFVFYNPPDYGENDVKLTIKNNEFKQVESVKNDVYSFIYLQRDGCRLEFVNNQINVYDSYVNLFKYIFGASTTINSVDSLVIKDNCMDPYIENNLLSGNCKNIPIDGFAECSPVDECLPDDPEYLNYNYECGGVHNKDPKESYDGKLFAIFYSTFNEMTKNDDLGGAIYVSTSQGIGNIEIPIQIYYTEFRLCAADYGGAIHITSTENSRVFDIYDCRFTACSYGWYDQDDREATCGGAIYINTKQANVKITKCIFENGHSDNGAAIYYCSDSLDSSKTSKTSLENDFVLKIDSCTFYHNEIYSKGGAIALIVQNSENLKPIEIVGCLFSENFGDQIENPNERPENGGAIYYEFNSQSNPSLANDAYEFLFRVSYCKFMNNIASFYGGAIYLAVTNYEPPKHFEISNCTFYSNRAGSESDKDVRDNGCGGDIYFYKQSTSPASQADNNEPCISILDCIFRGSNSNVNGGSIMFSIENNQPSRSIELSGCSFKGCTSDKGGAVDIISANKDVFLHVDNCVFRNRASLYFKSIHGLVENCQFVDINNANAIYYDSNSDSTNDDKSFTIDSCNFTQPSDNCILVYFVPKISSLFSFSNNNINISEGSTKTWIFGCDAAISSLQGNWKFEDNENYPYDEKYIKDDNSRRIGFEASCSNGFRCGVVPTEEPTTEAPTTEAPTTEAPTTEEPTTEAPTSEAPTTEEPTTEAPTTEAPTSEAPTSEAPTTEEPTTEAPTSEAPTTEEPTTEAPTSEAPTTEEPTSEAPTTEAPTSEAPTSEEPTTEAPTTEEPTTEAPTTDYVPGTNCERNHRCYFDGTNLSPSFIDFSLSEFIDIHYPDDGGAIYIKNYGMRCDVATFQNCSSHQGGGGGIYITLDREIPDEIFLQNITFKGCKAVFGGALYLYSIEDVNSVTIITCNFIENEANKKPSTAGDVFYGGSAIFMTMSNGDVRECKFTKNIGIGVKFYNNFDAKRTTKELESTSVLISNCFFEVDRRSTSSFYYVVGGKEKVPVEVNNCVFAGALSKDAHHIDGLVLSDKIEDGNPKLHIKLCKFSSNSNAALNRESKLLSSLSASFDESIQVFQYEVKEELKKGSRKDGNFISFLSISLVAFILLIACVIKYTKKQQESEIEIERVII